MNMKDGDRVRHCNQKKIAGKSACKYPTEVIAAKAAGGLTEESSMKYRRPVGMVAAHGTLPASILNSGNTIDQGSHKTRDRRSIRIQDIPSRFPRGGSGGSAPLQQGRRSLTWGRRPVLFIRQVSEFTDQALGPPYRYTRAG